jgi:hypothetical protein
MSRLRRGGGRPMLRKSRDGSILCGERKESELMPKTSLQFVWVNDQSTKQFFVASLFPRLLCPASTLCGNLYFSIFLGRCLECWRQRRSQTVRHSPAALILAEISANYNPSIILGYSTSSPKSSMFLRTWIASSRE